MQTIKNAETLAGVHTHTHTHTHTDNATKKKEIKDTIKGPIFK